MILAAWDLGSFVSGFLAGGLALFILFVRGWL